MITRNTRRIRLDRSTVGGRSVGPLEAEVLERLWEAARPLSGHELSARLSEPRAYTTVVTILSRLATKGLVQRRAQGHHFVYEPTGTQEELAAAAMRRVIDDSVEPGAVLARFVEQLSHEPKLLRRLAQLVERDAQATDTPPIF